MAGLSFVGDLFLPRRIECRASGVSDWVVNLEAPITRAATARAGKWVIKAELCLLSESLGALPRAACLANNHITDFGAAGLEETLQHLREIGIPYFGAGTVGDNCANPLVLDVDGCSVALMGYAARYTEAVAPGGDQPGVPPVEADRILRDAAAARGIGAQRVVVCLHWGRPHVYLPDRGSVELGRTLVDSGVDLVIGHHAHRIQPFETYGGTHIFYGLGSCVFPIWDALRVGSDGGVLERVTQDYGRNGGHSILARYSPLDGSVNTSELHFDGKVLRETGRDCERFRLHSAPWVGYERAVRLSEIAGLVLDKLPTYLRRPRLPNARQMRRLSRLFRGGGGRPGSC